MSENILAAIIFVCAISIVAFAFIAGAGVLAILYKIKNHDSRSIAKILDDF